MSERTSRRVLQDLAKPMGIHMSDRVLQLSLIRAQAEEEFGSGDAAEQWLISPAIGLEQRRPIDLIRTTFGTALVAQLLTRIRHGVYA